MAVPAVPMAPALYSRKSGVPLEPMEPPLNPPLVYDTGPKALVTLPGSHLSPGPKL